MDLLSIIIFFAVIARIFKKNSPEKYEETVRKAKSLGGEVVKDFRGSMKERRANYEQQRKAFEQAVQRKRPVKEQSTDAYEIPKQNVKTAPVYEQRKKQFVQEENDLARRQIYKSRVEANTSTILQRAKANADEDKVDVTLHSLEESHGHSAHVAPALHYHPEDEILDNYLEKIQDLIVKGYEGNLCFERDFVGEAMDMVNRFSRGGSV